MLVAIDHVILPVGDLESAIQQLSDRLSFYFPPERGEHPEFGTANALIWFEQGYLELIAVRDPAKAAVSLGGRAVSAFLREGKGIWSFALSSTDIEADVAALREHGSSVGEAQTGEWLSAEWRRSWRTAWIHTSSETSMPFLIQHDETPEHTRRIRDAAARQPFGIRALEELTIAAADLGAVAALYESELGLTVSRSRPDLAQITLPSARINLVSDPSMTTDNALLLQSVGLGARDLHQARTQLRERGVAFRDTSSVAGSSAEIDPDETIGARVILLQT